ncbi:MAG: NAD(P)H-hydrate epimerase [Planctomycetes bacterium]|nr:NAD(P)H-hydrate epimerase [Planctomycetota bacterium]
MASRADPLVLSRAQVREVDRRAIEEYGIPGVVLMENAGAGAARAIRELAARAGLERPSVGIACGGGNNGGDGFVVARHLANAGWSVQLLCTRALEELHGDALAMARICSAMRLPHAFSLEGCEVLVDALLGTGFHGALEPVLGARIAELNRLRASGARLLVALDLPSGLDADSGIPSDPCVRADATLTFAARKPGLLAASAKPFTGLLEVIDIGVPRALLAGSAAAE